MSAFLFCCLNGSLKVSDIIQAVKNTDTINTICDGFLYKVLYYIICVVVVTQNVLATEQHL